MPSFSEIDRLLIKDGNSYRFDVSEDWMQGRTAFGGLTAALSALAASKAYPQLPALRSAQFTFVAPVLSRLVATPIMLRTGRSTVFIEVEIKHDDRVLAKSILCFGSGREIVADGVLTFPVLAARPQQAPSFLFDGTIPSYLQHFETRVARTFNRSPPTGTPQVLLWLRHRDPRVVDSTSSLIAAADALPAPTVLFSNRKSIVSTATWTIDLLTDRIVTDERWWLAGSTADFSGDGYTYQTTTIWSTTGLPVARCSQTLSVFPLS